MNVSRPILYMRPVVIRTILVATAVAVAARLVVVVSCKVSNRRIRMSAYAVRNGLGTHSCRHDDC